MENPGETNERELSVSTVVTSHSHLEMEGLSLVPAANGGHLVTRQKQDILLYQVFADHSLRPNGARSPLPRCLRPSGTMNDEVKKTCFTFAERKKSTGEEIGQVQGWTSCPGSFRLKNTHRPHS